MEKVRRKNVVSTVQAIIFAIFTIYSFFFAQNIDAIGNLFLLIMSFICFVTLSLVGINLSFLRASLSYLSVFFFLCLLTIIFPIWSNTEVNWSYNAITKCILGLFIVQILTLRIRVIKYKKFGLYLYLYAC